MAIATSLSQAALAALLFGSTLLSAACSDGVEVPPVPSHRSTAVSHPQAPTPPPTWTPRSYPTFESDEEPSTPDQPPLPAPPTPDHPPLPDFLPPAQTPDLPGTPTVLPSAEEQPGE